MARRLLNLSPPSLPEATPEDLRGRLVAGMWRISRTGRLEAQRFGGAWQPLEVSGGGAHGLKRGPSGTLLHDGELLVQAQQRG